MQRSSTSSPLLADQAWAPEGLRRQQAARQRASQGWKRKVQRSRTEVGEDAFLPGTLRGRSLAPTLQRRKR